MMLGFPPGADPGMGDIGLQSDHGVTLFPFAMRGIQYWRRLIISAAAGLRRLFLPVAALKKMKVDVYRIRAGSTLKYIQSLKKSIRPPLPAEDIFYKM
jgi:hypothetical protein